jgi:hypothetical protein
MKVPITSMEILKHHPSLRNGLLNVMYLDDNGELVEIQLNKTILAIQSEYFLTALLHMTALGSLNLTSTRFKGYALQTMFDAFFHPVGVTHFDEWLNRGIIGHVYEASKYFLFESLAHSMSEYFHDELYRVLQYNFKTPKHILEKVYENHLFFLFTDPELMHSSSAASILHLLSRHLLLQLPSFVQKTPPKILGLLLETGLEIQDENTTFELFLQAYEQMSASDKKVIKPFILNHFDLEQIDEGTISRLEVSSSEFVSMYAKARNRGLLGLPVRPLFFSKNFAFDANNLAFEVDLTLEYTGFEMNAKLFVNSNNPAFLGCYFYWNVSKMNDRFPEFTCSLQRAKDFAIVVKDDIKRDNDMYVLSVKQTLDSREIDLGWLGPDFIKNSKVVNSIKKSIESRKTFTNWGWPNFIERSKLSHSDEYLLVVSFHGFASLN